MARPRRGREKVASIFVVVVVVFVYIVGLSECHAGHLRSMARISDASGPGAAGLDKSPYGIYFKADADLKPMLGGTTPSRRNADTQGYDREQRANVRKWLHGPDNVLGKNHVHGCKSFPFCNHIPPPLGVIPPPWDIPAPTPNPIYPSLAPFPQKLFGKDNMYGRDMYVYKDGKPHYKKDEKFWA